MRNLMCVVVASALLALTACSGKKADSTGSTGGTGDKPAASKDKPKDLIVGVWEIVSDKDKGTQEFKADGTFIMTPEIEGKPVEMKGKYKFVEDEVVELEFTPPGADKPLTVKNKVKVSKDELSMKDESGKEPKEHKFKKKK
jgi:uncharacterized protein (TIGR03066 family)